MREIVQQCLDALSAAGADRAQCWATRSEKTELTLEAGPIEGMFTAFNTSLSLTALVGKRKGTQTVNQLQDLEKAAAEAVEQARGAQEDEANGIAEQESGAPSYDDGPSVCDREAMVHRLNEFLDDVKERLPEIRIAEGGCEFVSKTQAVGNTNGVFITARSGDYGCGFTFSAGNQDVTGSMNYAYATFRDLGVPFTERGGTGMIMEQSVRELGAKALGDKFTGSVIFAPEPLGSMIGYYANVYLSGSALIAGTSLLKDKFSQCVAGKNVTFVSNPSDPELSGVRLTPDGFRTHDMTVIKNGILKCFLLNQYSARKLGRPRSANYGEHLTLQPGETSLNELICGVKRGLMVGRFSGGMPNDKGDFSGVAKNSFYIENGKISRPVQETMISGNLLDFFNNISGISGETLSTGINKRPWARVENISISG
ncbi:MAG: TldD/PmbA family protein [Oscillospiraceae bacterium]|jgi:PmbA protein|nr:TldD/PmbA family protein [Oscillospiraceae bacterium]